MDELEFLKQDWKKQEGNYPKLSFDEIYKMLWKKSSSIVRWIFVISIAELFFATLLNILFTGDDYWKDLETYNLKEIVIASYILSYAITLYFIYRFYKNYQLISATDDASTLMKNILKTRKTVKFYIAYVLISTGLVVVSVSTYMLYVHATTRTEVDPKYAFETLDWVKFIGIGALLLTLLLGVIWLFYKLLYGILLKRLTKNYKELKKLDI